MNQRQPGLLIINIQSLLIGFEVIWVVKLYLKVSWLPLISFSFSLLSVSCPDRHHGTPMLLEGVRCIGVELEYDSEQSDWQGFD